MNDKNEDSINDINIAAYFLSEEAYPYDTLCWFLAERLFKIENPEMNVSENLIKQRAAQIYFEQCPYDVLCYRIAEIDIYLDQNQQEKI
ncbi:MAG: hypothetical protein ACFFAS_10480 [Promethearchaeota archaeon]